MEIDIKVEGLEELEKKLLKLGAEMGEKQLYAALNNAALPIAKAAKNGAPESIAKHIKRLKHRSLKTRKIAIKGIKSTGKSAAGISVLVNKRKVPHAHLIEFGTAPRYTLGKGKVKKGAFRGKVQPQKFMTKAWEAHGGKKALDRFRRNLKKRVDKLTR